MSLASRERIAQPSLPGAALSETRVRGFEFFSETRTDLLTFLTDRAHQTSSTFSCRIASDLCGFLQEDPYAQPYERPALLQLYSYVNGAPVSSVDPLGLSPFDRTFPNPDLDWPVFDVDKSCGSKERRELIAAAITLVNSEGPRCLPTSIIAGLHLRHYKIVCGGNQPGLCGHEGNTPAEIVVFDDAFNPHSTCGCLQGVITHELVHKGGGSESTAQACAQSCFKCAKKPEHPCVCAFP